jgi:hypothetical protein
MSLCSEDLTAFGGVLALLELDECVMMSNNFIKSAKRWLMQVQK